MPIVISGGKSVTDYTELELSNLCKVSFVFAVNDSCFKFPCDVVIALDPVWIRDNAKKLREINKPIITRQWDCLKDMGLTITELPNEIISSYPLSGMAAVKIADKMAGMVEKKSYVLGMDGTKGHYTGRKSNSDIRGNEYYEALGLTNTINLSVHSKISAWPKLSKLPNRSKVRCASSFKTIGTAWVQGYARKVLMGDPI